ncbi:hypothetical protein Tsubulata_001502 [Turnera subulata]|uniref:NPH3 domain-containing protein n=1 Tax=Turnera subulata TaxID=218843 RepID=A0A9Q0F1H3_9ROSI|nr:hypothetical protein Tsubulata_001502 [Turnera subulata]
MSRWGGLGVVDTIYEEEYEHSSSSSSPLSPSPSSSPTPLHSRVQSWSLATGRKPDALIYVVGTCFRLHKDPLTSRSTYLKRQLTELSEITLPLNITAETFSLIVDFCYGSHVVISPYNVAALRTAAELLEMTQTNGKRDENLTHITEKYFRRVITVSRELLWIVFRSSLGLLPESETTALLLSRCIEALGLTGLSDELENYFDDVIDLPNDSFQVATESMQRMFASHDSLYRIVDRYIKVHSGMLTEEQKNELCNFIDCNKLSPHFLIHAVQNPRLPLRFIVRAMFMEQLNTRRALLNSTSNGINFQSSRCGVETVTLGAILKHDAAVREAAQLKGEMDATNSRIESLEKELASMKDLLQRSEEERCMMEKKLWEKSNKKKGTSGKEDNLLDYPKKISFDLEIERNVTDSSADNIVSYESEMEESSALDQSAARSASFHYGSREGKIQRGERGSTSFAGFQLRSVIGESSEESSLSQHSVSGNPGAKKKGLITRLKRRLWVSKSTLQSNSKRATANDKGMDIKWENGEYCDQRGRGCT